jgi:hypothetical protein
MQLDCKLIIESKSGHLQQIYTGFSELLRKRFVNLELIKKSNVLTQSALLKVIVNSKYRVIYDTSDGFNYLVGQGRNENLSYLSKILDEVDFYFKRSYSASIISTLKNREKVYPLGLSYFVSSESNFGETISVNFADRFKMLIKRHASLSKLFRVADARFNIEQFEYFPRIGDNSKILFMAKVWDPKDCECCNPEAIILMNNIRAECIRLCRKEFGTLFLGGLVIDKYAIKNYSDCLLPDDRISKRHEFLKRVKESDICIATTGLHNSIGWKFGEYVAASKAIVSEKLYYELPGEFVPRRNYLEFTTPEECVQAIYELINDKALRFKLMLNNYRYYHTYVRPDILVMNTLLTVLEKG